MHGGRISHAQRIEQQQRPLFPGLWQAIAASAPAKA